MPREARASQQILDQGSGATVSVGATSFSSATVAGTKWPLLPNQTLRIFNASIVGLPGTLGKIQLNSASIVVVLLDASLNALNVQNIVLAGLNMPTASIINGNQAGAVLTAVGDPLIELVAGFQIAGSFPSLQGAAGFQIQGFCDVFNTDSGSQNFTLALAALLSFVGRE